MRRGHSGAGRLPLSGLRAGAAPGLQCPRWRHGAKVTVPSRWSLGDGEKRALPGAHPALGKCLLLIPQDAATVCRSPRPAATVLSEWDAIIFRLKKEPFSFSFWLGFSFKNKTSKKKLSQNENRQMNQRKFTSAGRSSKSHPPQPPGPGWMLVAPPPGPEPPPGPGTARAAETRQRDSNCGRFMRGVCPECRGDVALALPRPRPVTR